MAQSNLIALAGNAQKNFTFDGGHSPNAQIATRFDSIAKYLAQGNVDVDFTQDDITVTNAATTAVTVDLPSSALILNVGLVFPTLIDVGAAGTVSFKVGTAAAGAEICANKQINDTADIVAGASTNVNSANKAQASGNALTFADAAVLYSDDARTIHGTYTVGGNNLVSATNAIFFIQYTRLLFNFV